MRQKVAEGIPSLPVEIARRLADSPEGCEHDPEVERALAEMWARLREYRRGAIEATRCEVCDEEGDDDY